MCPEYAAPITPSATPPTVAATPAAAPLRTLPATGTDPEISALIGAGLFAVGTLIVIAARRRCGTEA